ncbi:TPA: hypothetical protein I8672_002548 [Legionella pneumophila]|nr:hypothetical protein [Legionella pneumophila]HBD7284205.1 hypothetical protein [Legionella pneumophila]HEN8242194.1 hypothetical protein [Legionella pneumophila]
MNTKSKEKPIRQYWPLISLIVVSVLSAFAINWRVAGDMTVWMHYFMGIFLVIFSVLKIFHPAKFADGFEMYDILAKRTRIYAYIYPLLELALGLSYLAFILPVLTYVLTIVVLTFGSIGVIKALRNGLDINCPCMGSILDVPLSTVTLTEDIGMALMALMLLLMSVF